jgi:GTP cyclohydrolase III
MLRVVFDTLRENEDVIQVSEAEVEIPQDVVHEALKCLSAVASAQRHERKLEEAKRSGDGGLTDTAAMDRNLVLCWN